MRTFWRAFALIMLAQKFWKHWLVWRFFRRPPQALAAARPAGAELVSILQPILSGDPTLADGLRANLALETRYPIELIWLVDEDDATAQALCRQLKDAATRFAPERGRRVEIVVLPPPGERANPKMIKLVAGLEHARGTIVCVLDDDTELPAGGLEQCLPALDQPGAGLAFGLPFYRDFGNLWSALIALFVNDQSLLTYVPYQTLTEPFTINGMFYALRREVIEAIGGFGGLEGILADDFAVAQRVKQAGYRLVQTPLRHGIRTRVGGPRHYLSLMQRWFIFPRESLLRHLGPRDQALMYALGVLPALFPLPLAIATLLDRGRGPAWGWQRRYTAIYFGHSLAAFAHFNYAYLGGATPWPLLPLVPAIEMLFPFQLLAALAAPQRIVWRGHLMQVERGGGFRFVRRRAPQG